MRFKSFFAGILALSISFTSAVFAKEEVIVADSCVHTVSPGLVYSSSVELHNGYRQEIYSFEFTPEKETKIIPIYGKYIYGTSSVGQGIADYDGDYRVVGGINTDFFITSTGVPLSCLIDSREVVSSCDGRAAIGFTDEGNAIIGYPQISSKLYFGEEEFLVAHINKTPSVWGLYLVTDKFYSTTKSSVESIEIVLRPFADEEAEAEEKTEDIVEKNDNNKNSDENSENSETENKIEAGNEKVGTETENTTDAEKDSETEETNDEETEEEPEFDFSDYTFIDKNIEINSELPLVITEIRDNSQNSEIPEGCFVLCVPKEQFGNTVSHLKVGDELILKTEISQEFKNCENIFGAGNIILADGESIDLPDENLNKDRHPRTAVGIREDGSVVFVCVDGRRKGESHGFTIKELCEYFKDKGCISALNFDGGGSTTFYAADIGEEDANLKNVPSDGYERRVSDGLIFLNTSQRGEKPSYAAIYPGNHLIFNEKVELELSGEILFADENFFPINSEYEYSNLIVDKEFGKTQDSIFTPNGKTGNADIILQVRKGDSYSEFEVGEVSIIDTVSDFVIESNDTLITPFEDSAVFEISVSHNTLPVQYSDESIVWEIYIKDDVVKEDGSLENTEAEGVEVEDANIENTDNSENVVTEDIETDEISEKNSEAAGTQEVEAGEETAEAEQNNEIEEISEIDSIENYTKGYTKASIYDALFDNINFEFYPVNEGKEYRIIAKLGNSYAFVDIISEKYPFIDTEKHWASKNIYEMYKNGYFNGELDSQGNRLFMPARNMTRSEFCTVVGRILGASIEEATLKDENPDNQQQEAQRIENNFEAYEKSNFYDVPEWAKGYVEILYENGYIDSLVELDEEGITILNSGKQITRMDVVSVFSKLPYLENAFAYSEILDSFSDVDDLSDIQKDDCSKLVSFGIIKGYEDSTLRLTGNITRAEIATVFDRYLGIREYLSQLGNDNIIE